MLSASWSWRAAAASFMERRCSARTRSCSARSASAASGVTSYIPGGGVLVEGEPEAADGVVQLVVADAELLGQVGKQDALGQAVPAAPTPALRRAKRRGTPWASGATMARHGAVGHPPPGGGDVDAEFGRDPVGVAERVVGAAGVDQPSGGRQGGVDVVGAGQQRIGLAPVDRRVVGVSRVAMLVVILSSRMAATLTSGATSGWSRV